MEAHIKKPVRRLAIGMFAFFVFLCILCAPYKLTLTDGSPLQISTPHYKEFKSMNLKYNKPKDKPITKEAQTYYTYAIGHKIETKLTKYSEPFEQLHFNFSGKYYAQVKYRCRLGNRMFQLASAIGLSLANNLLPVYPSMKMFTGQLQKKLYNGSIDVPQNNWVTFKSDSGCDSRAWTLSKRYPNKNVLLDSLMICYKYFEKYKNIIRREFVFVKGVRKSVVAFYQAIDTMYYDIMLNGTIVGVHVRRGDMLSTKQVGKGHNVPDQTYFINAMEYFLNKHGGQVVFIVCGDDHEG